MISHQVSFFIDRAREKIFFVIESAIEQRDLFKRYCDGEDVFKEGEIITPRPFEFKRVLFILLINFVLQKNGFETIS